MLLNIWQVQRLVSRSLHWHCRRFSRRRRRHYDQVVIGLETWLVLGFYFLKSGAMLLGRLWYWGFGQLYTVENVESTIWHDRSIGRIIRVGLFFLCLLVRLIWRHVRLDYLLHFTVCHWQWHTRSEDHFEWVHHSRVPGHWYSNWQGKSKQF